MRIRASTINGATKNMPPNTLNHESRVHRKTRRSPILVAAALFSALFGLSPTLSAEEAAPAPAAPGAQPEAKKPPPAPYSLPWGLRPAASPTVLRLDTAIDLYSNTTKKADGSSETKSGRSIPILLLGSYEFTPGLAALARFGVIQSSPPTGDGATVTSNLLLGIVKALKPHNDIRMAAFLGLVLPVGMGGGDKPDLPKKNAIGTGILARSAMDNAMFAANDMVFVPGLDVAYVAHKLTVQAEITFLQLMRARGERGQADGARTNFTTGLHLGYFIIPQLSLGAEIRHQRWLTTPVAVSKDETLRDNTTFAVGPRAHFKLGKKAWARPGVSFAMGLDDPMKLKEHKVIQVDIPVLF